MAILRAAVVQSGPVAFDRARTIEKVRRLTAEAAATGARLVVFPEAFVSGYPKGADFGARVGMRSDEGRKAFRRYFESAVDVPGESTSAIGQIAAEYAVHLVIGVVERDGGTLYCTVLFFSPDGALMSKHRKLMPTAAERLVWGFGDGSTLPVFDTPLGKIGAVICWENYMPLLRMTMYSKGIQIYCAPTVDERDTWIPTMRHIARVNGPDWNFGINSARPGFTFAVAKSVAASGKLSLYSKSGFPAQTGSNPTLPVLDFYWDHLGFVPNHILALRPLSRLIEAECAISNALLFRDRALTRRQKELILLAVSAASENRYTAALNFEKLRTLGAPRGQLGAIVADYREADLPPADVALLDFAMKLGRPPESLNQSDIDGLRRNGYSDEHILEAVLTTSWGRYLCTLSSGIWPEPNFEAPYIPSVSSRGTKFQPPAVGHPGGHNEPYIRGADNFPDSFPPFHRVRRRWGFVPNLFRVQTLRPDLVQAELYALDLWLNTGDVLTQRQKEYIFLAISAANLNTYCVVAHCEVLRGLGVPEELSEQIVLDHHRAKISEAEKLLIDVCLKLARRPAAFGVADRIALQNAEFTERQILEAIVISAISNFINALNTGLGVTPDFDPRIKLNPPSPHPFTARGDHTEEMIAIAAGIDLDEETDAACVARVQVGDTEAFEALVRRHGRRVHRTLSGILRQDAEIEDAVQETFVKAYQHIGKFEGRSKFSTWLTRIAINTGLQRLRGRKEFESLDQSPETLDEFRPRQVQAWQDDPEQAFSKAERRELLLNALSGLPLKYRLVVMLRDLQQLSTKETAAAMGLEIPAVKARLFRGRLMLREALSPHFVKQETARIHG